MFHVKAPDENKHVSFSSYFPAKWHYFIHITSNATAARNTWRQTSRRVHIAHHRSQQHAAVSALLQQRRSFLPFSSHLLFCSFICFTQFSFPLRSSLVVICKVMGWWCRTDHRVHKNASGRGNVSLVYHFLQAEMSYHFFSFVFLSLLWILSTCGIQTCFNGEIKIPFFNASKLHSIL